MSRGQMHLSWSLVLVITLAPGPVLNRDAALWRSVVASFLLVLACQWLAWSLRTFVGRERP